MAYKDDELLEMKPRDKGAPCKRFVIELDATTPSSVNSSDFLIAASRPGSRLLQFTPSSTASRGVHCNHVLLPCIPLAQQLPHVTGLESIESIHSSSVPLPRRRACPAWNAVACLVPSVRCAHGWVQCLPAPVQSSG